MSVFTPRISASSQDRMHMRLDFRDDAKVTRGRKWRVTITDQDTGQRYLVRSASCGLPGCYCDAVVIAEKCRPH